MLLYYIICFFIKNLLGNSLTSGETRVTETMKTQTIVVMLILLLTGYARAKVTCKKLGESCKEVEDCCTWNRDPKNQNNKCSDAGWEITQVKVKICRTHKQHALVNSLTAVFLKHKNAQAKITCQKLGESCKEVKDCCTDGQVPKDQKNKCSDADGLTESKVRTCKTFQQDKSDWLACYRKVNSKCKHKQGNRAHASYGK